MKIDHLILGVYETNCYILRKNESAAECLIIDTGLDADELIDFLHEHNLNPVAVVLTHGHVDHITGLGVLRENYPDIEVYIHKLDAEMLTSHQYNLSAVTGTSFSTDPADYSLEEGAVVEQAGIRLQVFHTPGHTLGGICLYAENDGVVFTGDTLFADSVGRTDFPGGSIAKLITGIKEKLCVLPDETVVYPGHGPVTTIGREKAYNQYLQ